MNRRQPFRLLLLVLAGAGLAFACQRRAAPAPARTNLTIATAIPQAGEGPPGTNTLIRLLTLEPPIQAGWDGRPVPRALENWNWLPGNLGLSLQVHSGITFHDGTALTNQLAAEILRQQFIVKKNTLSSTVVSIEAEGADRVIVRTAQPEGFLLTDLSTIDFALPGNARIGTGAYKYDSSGPPVVLRAFDGYRLGRPGIETITLTEYPSQRAAWAAMMRADANMLHDVSREAIDFVQAEGGVQTHSFERGYYDALIFNQRHPVLARREVRQALSEAVDRAAIIERALRQEGLPAKGPFWPYLWALPLDLPSYVFDPRSARRRLDAAGLVVRPSDSPGHMPSRLRFGCLVLAADQRLLRVALMLQKQLYDVGVDLDVQPVTSKEFGQRIKLGTFDSLLTERSSYRTSAYVYEMWHSTGTGQAGPDFGHHADAALDQFRRAVSEDEVRAAVISVHRALYEDPPAVFIDWAQRVRALSSDVEVPVENGRDIMGTIQRWHWKPARPGLQGGR